MTAGWPRGRPNRPRGNSPAADRSSLADRGSATTPAATRRFRRNPIWPRLDPEVRHRLESLLQLDDTSLREVRDIRHQVEIELCTALQDIGLTPEFGRLWLSIAIPDETLLVRGANGIWRQFPIDRELGAVWVTRGSS